jgi:hypothetical protein
MDKNRSEVFGQFIYDNVLTYDEELLVAEQSFIGDLANCGGQERNIPILCPWAMTCCCVSVHLKCTSSMYTANSFTKSSEYSPLFCLKKN